MLGPAGLPERALCAGAAVLLLYLRPATAIAGLALLAAALALHLALRGRRAHHATEPPAARAAEPKGPR
jgi:hypothetical protein